MVRAMSAGNRRHKGSGRYALSGGFVRIPRKAWRRRKKGVGASIFFVVALVLLVAGFMVRRLISVAHPHYLTHRVGVYPGIPDAPSNSPDAVAQGHSNLTSQGSSAATVPTPADHDVKNQSGTGEKLTPEEHRALDELIRERSK
jgi:hypothetical protein